MSYYKFIELDRKVSDSREDFFNNKPKERTMWLKPKDEESVVDATTSTSTKEVAAPDDNFRVSLSEIGKSVTIKGDIFTEENMFVDGRVDGAIYVKNNNLKIGPNGQVKANTFAETINVEGELRGDAHASKHVFIHKTGRIFGNIYAPRVSIEDGATLKGSVDMEVQNIEKHFPAHFQQFIQKDSENNKGSKMEVIAPMSSAAKKPSHSPSQHDGNQFAAKNELHAKDKLTTE